MPASRSGGAERKFSGSGPANFAVRPYPSQWERHIEVKDGWRVFVRPIRPEDEPAIHELLRHVTPDDLRLRFFAPMKEFTHEFIARLTQLDYARAMAFVAFDEATNEMVGVVRIHSDSIYESGEYAILLRSDLKGRGLGWALMQLIIEYAKSEGLKVISGDVLQENTVMLEMCRDLGFEVKPDPVEPDICDVRLQALGSRAASRLLFGARFGRRRGGRPSPGRLLRRLLTMIVRSAATTSSGTDPCFSG